MGIRVETGRGDHELHDGGIAPGRVKLESGGCTTTFVLGVDVGHVPIDVPTGSESTDEDDGAIAECFCGCVPAHVLHCEHGGVVVPLASRIRQVSGVARIQNPDRLATVIVAVHVVIVGRGWRAITLGVDELPDIDM